VFVAGRFAGTVSPVAMAQNRDGVAAAVRITGEDSLTTEFARFTATDTECCPSSRVRVSYRVERTATHAVLVPTDARRVR
jgi:hypothetical protein